MAGLLHQRAHPRGISSGRAPERRARRDNLVRDYKGLTLQGAYRLMNRIHLGGDYTWSELKGNMSAETTSALSSPAETADQLPAGVLRLRPERPDGASGTDPTHKLRAWAAVDFPTFLGNFNVSVLQSFDTGGTTRRSARSTSAAARTTTARRPRRRRHRLRPGRRCRQPGYSRRRDRGYFFSDRGEFRRRHHLHQPRAQLRHQPVVAARRFAVRPGRSAQRLQRGRRHVERGVLTHRDAGCVPDSPPALRCARFNPMAGDVPVEGVHYERIPASASRPAPTIPVLGVDGVAFGGSFQTPRTYSGSVGFRF